MTDRLYAKYLWLINTVYKAGHISFEKISAKWDNASINDLHQPLRLRTFHNHRNAIMIHFGILIECKRGTKFYFISNPDVLEQDFMNRWLLNSFAVSNILMDCRDIADRIIFENIPSEEVHLAAIATAMRTNSQLKINYEDFFGNIIRDLVIAPYFLRLFKRRWYVVSFIPKEKELHRFGLDRIKRIEVIDSKFCYPKGFSPQEYVCNYYGVFHDAKPQVIQLKAYKEKPAYLRSLPLHHSQKELIHTDDYTIFEYYMAPTYDLIQDILCHGNQLEVLSPSSFRQRVKTIIHEMYNFYK